MEIKIEKTVICTIVIDHIELLQIRNIISDAAGHHPESLVTKEFAEKFNDALKEAGTNGNHL